MAYYKSPKFIIHVLVTLFSIALFLTPTISHRWPQFCTNHNWAFFNTVGVVISLMVISLTSCLAYTLFGDINWLLYFLLLLVLGTTSLASGIAFLVDSLSDCTVNEFPLLRGRSDDEFYKDESKSDFEMECPLGVLLALLPPVVLGEESSVEKNETDEDYYPPEKGEINTKTEKFVVYSLFCLGIVFLLLSIYFLIRRD